MTITYNQMRFELHKKSQFAAAVKFASANPAEWVIKHDCLGWTIEKYGDGNAMLLCEEVAMKLIHRQQRYVRSGPIGELP